MVSLKSYGYDTSYKMLVLQKIVVEHEYSLSMIFTFGIIIIIHMILLFTFNIFIIIHILLLLFTFGIAG